MLIWTSPGAWRLVSSETLPKCHDPKTRLNDRCHYPLFRNRRVRRTQGSFWAGTWDCKDTVRRHPGRRNGRSLLLAPVKVLFILLLWSDGEDFESTRNGILPNPWSSA